MKFRLGVIVTLLACAVPLVGCDRKAPAVAATAPAAQAAHTAPGPSRSFAALVVGVDYAVIGPAPVPADSESRIDVVEAFSYACPHCAEFEPKLAAWRARLPADVHFESVPMPFNDVWTEYARTYYAAVDLGLIGRTHAALFDALHVKDVRIDSVDTLVQWYASTTGADAASFRAAMYSPGTDARIAGAHARATRWGIDSTPTLVVDDRYRVLGFSTAQGGFDRTLAVADALIAELRKSRGPDS